MTDDADELERSEAEALAGALEGGERAAPPADALEAAALLRYSGREGELASERAEAVLAALLPQVERPRGRRLRVVGWGAGLLAAAAALLVVLAQPGDRLARAPSQAPIDPQPVAASVPAPPAALLSALAGAAKAPDPATRARFEMEMQAYRRTVLSALERAYPVRIGRLESRGRR